MNTQTIPIKEQRRAAREKGFGFLKGRIAGSDAFLAEKHAETARELENEVTSKDQTARTVKMTVDFPPELEAQIEREARLRGITPEAFVIGAIRAEVQGIEERNPQIGDLQNDEGRAVIK